MTQLCSNAAATKSIGSSAIVAAIAIAFAVVCATGIAAFAGWLPQSDRVAIAMTTMPIVDVQIDLLGNEAGPDDALQPSNEDATTSVD